MSHTGEVNDQIESHTRQHLPQIRFEVQVDHSQAWIDKRQLLPVPRAPNLRVTIQQQPAQHADSERRRRTSHKYLHHSSIYELRRCSQVQNRNNIAA
jgi:hypothetical protein